MVTRDTAVSLQYGNEVKLHAGISSCLIFLCLKDKIILKGEHLDRTKGNDSILFLGKNTYIVPVMLKIIIIFFTLTVRAHILKGIMLLYSPTKSSTIWFVLKWAVQG